MAVDILIDGRSVDVDPQGVVVRRMLPTSYSVQEDATPTNPADSSGGFGTIQFGLTPYRLASWLRKKYVEVRHGSNGFTTGFITAITDTGPGGVSLTADSRLSLLNVDRKVPPFVGTLGDALLYYLGVCNLTSGIIIESQLAGRNVTLKAIQGNMWDNIKQLLSVHRAEISLVSDKVVIRRLRLRVAETYRDEAPSISYDDQTTALAVEVYMHKTQYKVNTLVYPPDITDYDDILPSVDAGQTITGVLELEASLTSIEQPVCVDYVADDYQATSVYAVAGNDGKAIPAAQWLSQGGSLVLELDETTQNINYTLTGATGDYAPYQIAMTSGSSNYYNSLRVRGTGVVHNSKKFTFQTGVDPDRTQTEVGVTVDNFAINTMDQLHNAALRARNKYAGNNMILSVTSRGINRRGVSGSYAYPKISEFNLKHAGMTIGAFNIDWLARAAHGIEDFNNEQYAEMADNFVNQAFGNVVGARRRYGWAWFRIKSSTITSEQISYTAELDTTIADFNKLWDGSSILGFNSLWMTEGLTMDNFKTAPLMDNNPFDGDYGVLDPL